MPSAATPCGIPTGSAFHLVTHLPPAPALVLFILQFLIVFCFTDMIGGKPIIYIYIYIYIYSSQSAKSTRSQVFSDNCYDNGAQSLCR